MDKNGLPSRITINPAICQGKPCIRNLRYPVAVILDMLAAGESIEEILNEFDDLAEKDIRACLEYVDKGDREGLKP